MIDLPLAGTVTGAVHPGLMIGALLFLLVPHLGMMKDLLPGMKTGLHPSSVIDLHADMMRGPLLSLKNRLSLGMRRDHRLDLRSDLQPGLKTDLPLDLKNDLHPGKRGLNPSMKRDPLLDMRIDLPPDMKTSQHQCTRHLPLGWRKDQLVEMEVLLQLTKTEQLLLPGMTRELLYPVMKSSHKSHTGAGVQILLTLNPDQHLQPDLMKDHNGLAMKRGLIMREEHLLSDHLHRLTDLVMRNQCPANIQELQLSVSQYLQLDGRLMMDASHQ